MGTADKVVHRQFKFPLQDAIEKYNIELKLYIYKCTSSLIYSLNWTKMILFGETFVI
jgi:hypothetical protein